jgi:hypothetical protein
MNPNQNPLAASIMQYMRMQQPHIQQQQATYNPGVPQQGFNAQAGLQQGQQAAQLQWEQLLKQLQAAQQARATPAAPTAPTMPGPGQPGWQATDPWGAPYVG